MISVEEARQFLDSKIKSFGTEKISLSESYGRILQENIYTDRPLPPYHRVTMDGIAINFKAYQDGKRQYPIENVAPAGAAQMNLTNPASCLEVMTGAVLPKNADTVIRYEDLNIEDSIATIQDVVIKKDQNVHFQGSDRPVSECVVKAGTRITQVELGIAASTGYHEIVVSKHPKVAIISTGDELVNVDQTPEPYQIRKSNVHMIEASLKSLHIHSVRYHIDDDYNEVLSMLRKTLSDYDVIILSGGVSKGKFDYVPKALDELHVSKVFHKIKQRPGKPFWFGHLDKECIVFALPGNPVSSFMCTINYILPWLNKALGQKTQVVRLAQLETDIKFNPNLTYYPIVKTYFNSAGILIAKPVNNNGSGDFASLSDGDAFLELPLGKDLYLAGKVYNCIYFRKH